MTLKKDGPMTQSAATLELDDPSRVFELRKLIQRKGFLKRYYLNVYEKYRKCLAQCPSEGITLELGSGASFVKDVIPNIMTSDVIPYEGIDQVVDATKMPFANQSLKAICMMNVFHHIPDAKAFFKESIRCLKPGGRLFIEDQHVGWLSRWIFKHLHHEPFNPGAIEWKFDSSGPLSDANGALAWIVFQRDIKKFEKEFPELRVLQYRTHSPLSYWVAGGLKEWTMLPGFAYPLVAAIERLLTWLSPGAGCFVDIEIEKI